MKKLDDMITDLLDMDLIKDDEKIVFSDEAKELIHSIAEKCKKIPLINKTNDKAEEYAVGLSAEDIYIDMLHKIVEAPTRIHMEMSARLLIPIIDRKLREEGLDGRKESDIH